MKDNTQYGGATGHVAGGMRLRSCSHRTLDGVTFRSGVSYPADDPIVRKYRFHFRVAPFPPSVAANPAPEPGPQLEPENTPEDDFHEDGDIAEHQPGE